MPVLALRERPRAVLDERQAARERNVVVVEDRLGVRHDNRQRATLADGRGVRHGELRIRRQRRLGQREIVAFQVDGRIFGKGEVRDGGRNPASVRRNVESRCVVALRRPAVRGAVGVDGDVPPVVWATSCR